MSVRPQNEYGDEISLPHEGYGSSELIGDKTIKPGLPRPPDYEVADTSDTVTVTPSDCDSPLRSHWQDATKATDMGEMERTSINSTPQDHAEPKHDTTAEVNENAGAGDNESLHQVQSQGDKLPKGRMVMIVAALAMATFLAALDQTIITTALPTISQHYHASQSQYSWVGSSYLLASAAAAPSWGKVSDIFGRKPILVVSNVIFLIGSLICGVSRNIEMLLAGRVVQGIGGGGLLSLVYICIGDLFSMRNRGIVFGVVASVWAIAGALGPVLGGVFTSFTTWRWCFYINLPLDGVALLALLVFLKIDTPQTPILAGLATIDWLGSITVAGGTVMLLLGLEYGGESYPWDSAIVLCLIIFGVFTLGVFLLIQGKVARYPLVPLSLFSSLRTGAPFLACLTHGLVSTSILYYIPMYFQTVLGATPLLSGVYTFPNVVTDIGGCVIQSIVIKKLGILRPMIGISFAVMTLGIGLYIDYPAHADWAKVILYQGISGLGAGPLYESTILALQSQVRPQDLASSTASFNFVRYTGNAVGIALGSVIFQNVLAKKITGLNGKLPSSVLDKIRQSSAGTMVDFIKQLPKDQQQSIRQIYTDSLKMTWVFYTAVSGVGLLGSALFQPAQLTEKHEFTRTGLDVQEEDRQNRLRRKHEKKEEKRAQKGGDIEVARPEVKND